MSDVFLGAVIGVVLIVSFLFIGFIVHQSSYDHGKKHIINHCREYNRVNTLDIVMTCEIIEEK